MKISEVRIKLMEDPSDRLCAFCSITLDECFVIRDLKIIHGAKGAFVAMPSRKLTDRCPKCHSKNHLRASYCNQCGVRLHSERASKDDDGRAKLYADIAHPINSDCRDMIQQMVIASYEEELVKSQQEGYVCTYDDFEEDRYASLNDYHEEAGPENGYSSPPPQELPPRQQNVRMTLETQTGKVLRVDAGAEKEKNTATEHASSREQHRESQAVQQKKPSEGFGEGII